MFGHNELEFNPKGGNLVDKELAVSGIENANFFFDLVTGGGYSQNKYQRELAKRQNEYNQALYKFEGEEMERQYNYRVDGLEIAKRNNEQNLRFQENSRQQEWNFGMAIRDYQHSQDLKEFAQSKAQYDAQKGFNELGEGFANLQQDRYMMEQKIGLQFDKQQTFVKYAGAVNGLGIQKQKLKSSAAASLRQEGLQSLKEKGQAAARGQAGRSGAKQLNAAMMEYAIKEADIVNTLILDTAKVDLDLLLTNQQKAQDDLAATLTENNLDASDSMNRTKIKMARVQADLEAEANLMIKPEIAPPLPTPLALPRPEYQDIYEPKQGPEPMEAIPFQTNLGVAFVNQVAKAVTFAGAGTKGFTQGFSFANIYGG